MNGRPATVEGASTAVVDEEAKIYHASLFFQKSITPT
jgi:hypothetical protein